MRKQWALQRYNIETGEGRKKKNRKQLYQMLFFSSVYCPSLFCKGFLLESSKYFDKKPLF